MELGNNSPENKPEDAVINPGGGGNNMPEPEKVFGAVVGILILLIVISGAMGSFYKVDTEETGVLLRLGKVSGLSNPGLHFKLPWGIDRVIKVKTGRVFKEEFGFRSKNPGIRTSYLKKGFEDESLMLTGDLNVVDLEWIVQFQVADPSKFLFNIQDPVTTVRDLSEAIVRKIIGDSNVTDVLTTERQMLASAINKELQKVLKQYDIGIRIVTVKFQDVNPPQKVKAAFNGVNEAEQQKESLILQAREQYNKEVPRAKGVAKQMIQRAEGYALERVNNAKGEVARFVALVKEYRKFPEVTRTRLYLENLETVLPKVKQTYIIDDGPVANKVLPVLPLDKSSLFGGNQ